MRQLTQLEAVQLANAITKKIMEQKPLSTSEVNITVKIRGGQVKEVNVE